MLPLLACLLILQTQPAEIDWNPRPAPEPPAQTAPAKAEPTFEEALAASYAADDRAGPPQTEEDRVAAANAAAIARAEQAGRDTNATTPWPDDGKMRCKSTDSGFVCGNSDKALQPDSPSRQALDNLLNRPN